MLLVAASLDFPGLPRTLPPPSKTPPAAQPCNLASCSTVGNKLPRVTSTPAAGPSVESGLAPEDKKAFEHLLGHALRDTAPVCAITRETGLRVASFLRAAGSLRGLSFDDVLRQAFVTPQCDAHNTGYVGPDVRAIRAALEGGNIREVWGLLYVLTKSGYLSRLLLELLEGASPLATPASLQAALGMNASALARRWAEVRVTATLNSTELRYCQGVKDFLFEPYESWVRFDFDAATLGGAPLWRAARRLRAGGCSVEGLRSDDPRISPPLSAAEQRYQCGGAAACVLQWWPGELCYDVVDEPLPLDTTPALPPDGAADLSDPSARPPPRPVPGYAARAAALGYRAVAGPSGTTANMLQLARLLGLGEEGAVLVRLAMVAWMLPTNDHSFFEVMLGAEPFMPQHPAFSLSFGLPDLGRLFPPGHTLRASPAGASFRAADVWGPLGARLAGAEGRRLLDAMAPASAVYTRGIVEAHAGEQAAAPPASCASGAAPDPEDAGGDDVQRLGGRDQIESTVDVT